MTFKDFTLLDLETQLGLTLQRTELFQGLSVPEGEFDHPAWEYLKIAGTLPRRTLKARSVFYVAPLLMVVQQENRDFVNLYSGYESGADPTRGLTGKCDFLFTRETDALTTPIPILPIVEVAYEQEDAGINQCAAQLYGLRAFSKRMDVVIPELYGCVTDGYQWRFLKLTDHIVEIDQDSYSQWQSRLVIGILQHVINGYRKILSDESLLD